MDPGSPISKSPYTPREKRGELDRWILHELSRLVEDTTGWLDRYQVFEVDITKLTAATLRDTDLLNWAADLIRAVLLPTMEPTT
mgnify:CR=1 FL=1